MSAAAIPSPSKGLAPKSALPGPSDLYKASVAGDLSRVKDLVEGAVAHINVNDPWVQELEIDDGFDVQKNSSYALSGAAGAGKIEVVEYLLSKGANDFNSAVVAALETRKYNIAKMILDTAKFTDINSNAVKYLFKYATTDIVRAEVDKRKIDVTFPIDPKTGLLPIFVAMEQPNVSVFEYLLNEKNVDPNSRNKLNQSVLLKACLSLTDKYSHGAYTQIVATLLNKGAKATEAYSDQFWKDQDVLDVVCQRGSDCKEIMVMLLDAGAKAQSPRGRIHELGTHEDSQESMQLFLDRGATLTEKNSKGHLPIHPAALYGQVANLEYLIKKCGADVNGLTEDGKTAVDLAGSKVEVVEALTKMGGKKASALTAASS